MSFDWPLSREQKRECLLSFFQRECQALQNDSFDANCENEASGTEDVAGISSNAVTTADASLPWPSKLAPSYTSRSESSAMPHMLPKAQATGGLMQRSLPLSDLGSSPGHRIPKLQLQPTLHSVPGSPAEPCYDEAALLLTPTARDYRTARDYQTARDSVGQKTLPLTTARGSDSSMQSMTPPRTPLERKLRLVPTPCKRGWTGDMSAASPGALSSVHLAEAMGDLAQDLPTTMMRARLDLTYVDRPEDNLAARFAARFTTRENLTAAVGNVVQYGARGGKTGLVTGAAIGAACGIVPAIFTFGLSIPIGAAIGGSLGLGTGTAGGTTLGLYFQLTRGNQREAEQMMITN